MIKGVIDELKEMSDALELARGDKSPVDSHDILRGIDPTLSNQKKHQPKGTDGTDFWVLKYGDPLANSDAAFALAYKVEPAAEFEIKMTGHGDTANASVTMLKKIGNKKGSVKALGAAQHLCWAVTVAAIKYHRSLVDDI